MFLKTKDSTPIFAAVCMLSLMLIVWAFFILIIIIKVGGYNMSFSSVAKYSYIVIHLLLIFGLFHFYKKERVKDILISFGAASISKKRIWLVGSLIMLIGPLIAIMFSLKKSQLEFLPLLLALLGFVR